MKEKNIILTKKIMDTYLQFQDFAEPFGAGTGSAYYSLNSPLGLSALLNQTMIDEITAEAKDQGVETPIIAYLDLNINEQGDGSLEANILPWIYDKNEDSEFSEPDCTIVEPYIVDIAEDALEKIRTDLGLNGKEQIYSKLDMIAKLSERIQKMESDILKDISEENHDEVIDIFMKVEELTYNIEDAQHAIEKYLKPSKEISEPDRENNDREV